MCVRARVCARVRLSLSVSLFHCFKEMKEEEKQRLR